MPYKQKLGVEKKIEIIRDYLNNRISMSEAARRGGVARDTISHWAENYEADALVACMDIPTLQRELRSLEYGHGLTTNPAGVPLHQMVKKQLPWQSIFL